MPQRLAGQLVDGGDPVADEPVFVVDTGPADESNWSIVATDRSAADGSWSVTVPNTDPKRYHAVAEFEESGTLKNALSKPFLTSQPFAQANAVSVGFDVLSPAVSVGSAIPDSAVYLFDAIESFSSDQDGTTVNEWTDELADYTVSGGAAEVVSDGVGGNLSLRFDSNSDVFVNDSADLIDFPFTIITLIERTGASTDNQWTIQDANDDDDTAVYWSGSNEANSIFVDDGLQGTNDLDVNVQTGVFESASNSRLREDGTETASGDVGDFRAEDGFRPIAIGGRSVNDRLIEGDVAFVGVYDDDLEATGELEDEEQRVADKYGINI